jgi:hypothetical protein
MRHADIRTTMNIYGDVVTNQESEAHSKIVGLALPRALMDRAADHSSAKWLKTWRREWDSSKRTGGTAPSVTFSLNPDGSISNARLAAVSPLADFSIDYHWSRPVPFRIRAQFRFISDQPLQRTSAYRQARDRAVPEPRSVRPSASQSFVLRCKSE